MDEVEQRLRLAADTCVKCYEAWKQNQKEGGTREQLLEAVHELRKVAARLEIEMAVSERNEMASRPIPIPPHRSSRPRHGGEGAPESQSALADEGNNGNVGNRNDDQRPPQRSSHHQGMRPRRPMPPRPTQTQE